MKKVRDVVSLVFILLITPRIAFPMFDKIEDLTFPERVGYVNDFSGIFSQETRQELEEKLKKYEQDTNRIFLVVSHPALSCIFEEERCAIAIYKQWQIKKIRKNKQSILLFFSGANRRGERSFIGFSSDSDEKSLDRAGYYQFTDETVRKLTADGKVPEANVAYINFVIKALSTPIK